MQISVQLAAAQCGDEQDSALPKTSVLLGVGGNLTAPVERRRVLDRYAICDRRHAAWRPLKYMDTPAHPATGRHPGQPSRLGAGSHAEIGRLLADLEQRLAELDRLHRAIAEDAHALAHAAAATPEDRDAAGARSVYSIPDAAAELGVSVSMLHKLLRQRRLGHLKVGARTLITAEQLEQFREASKVAAPEASPAQNSTVTSQKPPVHQPRQSSAQVHAPVVSVAAS